MRKKKKILATSWHTGGANAITPVINELNMGKKIELVIIGHQYSKSVFDNFGIRYKTIESYGLKDVSLNSMGVILDEEKPDLIFTGSSPQDRNNKDVIEQNMTLAARFRKIPSLAVLDYWANYWQRVSDINSGERFKFLPDKLAIMDHYAKEAMLRENFPEEKLIITGNPYFDNLRKIAKNFDQSKKNYIRKKFNFDILIFYAGGPFKIDLNKYGYWYLDNVMLINEVIKELSNILNCGLVVNFHPRLSPNEREEINKYILNNGNGRIIVENDIRSQELILSSDIFATAFSTLAVEAILMKKPCISLQPNLKFTDEINVLTGRGIIPVAYTRENCVNLVKKAITNSKYLNNTLIKKASSFRVEPNATTSVVNLIYDTLK
ncbi:hypothetical protein HYT23_03865 [Candidatus Pacearchaeota archaeon]|nr:hypothetical protein [Candidatus Pacearchaeota archaeon]